jgi:division protein CdvB (Snf7/Vps24/ESCRT-III family)
MQAVEMLECHRPTKKTRTLILNPEPLFAACRQARIEAVAGKLGAAIKMQKVTKSMGQITGTMSKVLQTMKLDDIQATMDKVRSDKQPPPPAPL